jgi:hypothetical protein
MNIVLGSTLSILNFMHTSVHHTLGYYIIFILTFNGTTNIDCQSTQYRSLALLSMG